MSSRNRPLASALGRPLDFNYPTNRAVVFLSFIAGFLGLIVALVYRQSFSDSLLTGFLTSVASFWGWAITRELDPDNDLSAFVSAFFAIVFSLLIGHIGLVGLLAGLLLLQGTRILNRIVGLGIAPAESIFVLICAVIIALASTWLWILYIAIVFLIDYFLPYGAKQHLPLSGVAMVIMIVLALTRSASSTLISVTSEYFAVLAILSIAFSTFIIRQKRIQSLTDLTNKPVLVARVQWAQITSLGIAWTLALLQGWQGILWVTPLWATFCGILVYQLWLLLKSNIISSNTNNGPSTN